MPPSARSRSRRRTSAPARRAPRAAARPAGPPPMTTTSPRLDGSGQRSVLDPPLEQAGAAAPLGDSVERDALLLQDLDDARRAEAALAAAHAAAGPALDRVQRPGPERIGAGRPRPRPGSRARSGRPSRPSRHRPGDAGRPLGVVQAGEAGGAGPAGSKSGSAAGPSPPRSSRRPSRPGRGRGQAGRFDAEEADPAGPPRLSSTMKSAGPVPPAGSTSLGRRPE